MRNTSGPERDNWATYARTARENAGLSKMALARRLGIDRATIHRWETGQTRPDDALTVQAWAAVFGIDLDDALVAAGLRPGELPDVPEVVDPEIELVRTDPELDPEMKIRIVTLIMDRRAREREASLAETQQLIRIMKQRRTG